MNDEIFINILPFFSIRDVLTLKKVSSEFNANTVRYLKYYKMNISDHIEKNLENTILEAFVQDRPTAIIHLQHVFNNKARYDNTFLDYNSNLVDIIPSSFMDNLTCSSFKKVLGFTVVTIVTTFDTPEYLEFTISIHGVDVSVRMHICSTWIDLLHEIKRRTKITSNSARLHIEFSGLFISQVLSFVDFDNSSLLNQTGPIDFKDLPAPDLGDIEFFGRNESIELPHDLHINVEPRKKMITIR